MISKDRAIRIAYEWHGGQWSPLYSFASSDGVITNKGALIAEIHDCLLSDIDPVQDAELNRLLHYVKSQGVSSEVSNK